MIEDNQTRAELDKINEKAEKFGYFLEGYKTAQKVRLNDKRFEDKDDFEQYLRKEFDKLVK